jgi:outer membrane usher protein FimD/PapC
VFLRAELEGQRWINSLVRASQSSRGIDVETGRALPAGEGFGYRVGTSANSGEDGARFAYGAAEWALRSATLDGFLSVPAQGRGPRFAQVGISGALAAVNGYWGATRRISDSFAVADLGVPQAGVEILLNNQVQGRTDAQGRLFIPQVGSFGRQDVGVNDRQVDMRYTLSQKVRSITPPSRSGTVVQFGARRERAVAGMAWIVAGGQKKAVDLRAWTMTGATGQFTVQTGRDGDFYVEDVTPGRYRGTLRDDRSVYTCSVNIPDFEEPVHELPEGILCE